MTRSRRLALAATGLLVRIAVAWMLLWSVVFLLIRGLSADPATAIAGLYTDTATRQRLEDALGLSTPMWQALLNGLWKAVTLDFGVSLRSGRGVWDLVLAPAALSLLLSAAVATVAILLAIGVFLFASTGRVRLSRGVAAVMAAGAGVPPFMLALACATTGFASYFGLPTHGVPSDGAAWVAWLQVLIVPIAVLLMPTAPYAVFRALAATNDVVRAQWYQTFLAYGGSRLGTAVRIGWPNAVGMLLDIGVNTFLTVLTASVAVEFVLGIPALGTTVLDAIEAHDAPIVLAVASGVSLLTIVLVLVRERIRSAVLPDG